MEQMEYKALQGFGCKKPLFLYGVTVEPGQSGQALVRRLSGMERVRFERQYNVLLGYALLALGREPGPEELVALESLKLPQEEGRDALAAVWFSRACRSREPAGVVMAVYNGFGALPGGFPEGKRRAEQYLGPELSARFQAWVRGAKTEENDLAERTPQPVDRAFWSDVDPELLRGALRRACLECRV